MTYPPDGSGGYPPGGYPGAYGPGGYPQGPPPQPPRSPWTSPAVLVAIGAGVLLVVAGVLAAFLLIPSDEESSDTTAATTTNPEPATITSTVTRSPTPPQTTVTTTPPPVPNGPTPTVTGADWQGFVTGPRCNAADDPAVAIGQTSRSRVVICQVGNQTGRWYYKGQAPEGGIELQFPTRVGNTFEARNGAVRYLVSPASLTIVEGGSVLTNEPMLAYWSLPG
ncbi:hypothetical protein R4227_17605 [Gordonia amicalis]|uniref:Serine/threonine protein kinase n=1 Tax=Gordonia amicalis TaxID=89053 RepID=A0ABU4DKH2_9ACTN|nr:hypothetical protein [Gordonia amicalis]MDV6310258.1 hypothetical protein [Gordonia amicalis]MDV7101878.1 hypothetical protein [Gordonia amicalis]